MINDILNNITSIGKGLSISGKEKDNIEQINDNVFIFNVFINNGTSRVGIKFSAIEELNIVDDLRYFFTYGTLTIGYNNDVLESFESVGGGLSGPTKNAEPFVFRGDGRDLLEIEIMPQMKEQKCLEVYASEGEKKNYCIKHLCSIYKYEDITVGKGEKKRKFYFWDRDYQLLREINLSYSTADKVKNNKSFLSLGSDKVAVSKSNTDTSAFTGDAIQDILKETLVTKAGSKFKKGSWDMGGSKISYSSSGQNKAVDDLNYILSYHMSDSNNKFMPCILKKERYTDKYTLIPINKYYTSELSVGGVGGFISSGPGVIEDLIIGKLDPATGGNGVIPKNLTSKKIIPTDYNTIDDYTFQKVDANELQEYMSTQVVYGLDPRGFFNSNLKNNNFQSATKIYDEVFVKPNKGGPGRSPSSNLADNKLRKENKNVSYNFVPYAVDENQTRSFGINKSLINLFFKNTSIQFKIRGNTIRQTGKFFTVNRTDSNTSDSHDNTVMGKYLITYVSHEFKKGTYETTVLGVKSYSNEKPKFADTI